MLTESDVFISYARDTAPLAKQLSQALETQGFPPWIDFKDLRAGQDWQDEIGRALDKAATFLILMTPDSLSSSWQETEWRAALTRVWSDSAKRLIPVVVGGTEPPPFLRNWISLDVDPAAEPTDWTRHVVDALRTPNQAAHAPLAAVRRAHWQRLEEITRAAKELGKNEPTQEDLPPGLRR